MELSLKYRDDLLALMEEVQREKAKEGHNIADTRLSLLAVKDGSFIGILRNWKGGDTRSPTLARCERFESYLRDELGEKKYKQFVASRASSAPGSA